MARGIGTRKQRTKPSAAYTKLDLEEGRSERPTEQVYKKMNSFNCFVGEHTGSYFAVALNYLNNLI
jgi:hypothetical protein